MPHLLQRRARRHPVPSILLQDRHRKTHLIIFIKRKKKIRPNYERTHFSPPLSKKKKSAPLYSSSTHPLQPTWSQEDSYSQPQSSRPQRQNQGLRRQLPCSFYVYVCNVLGEIPETQRGNGRLYDTSGQLEKKDASLRIFNLPVLTLTSLPRKLTNTDTDQKLKEKKRPNYYGGDV